MIDLPDVSIICADCVTPQVAIKAIEFSCREIKFKEAILFTDKDIKHDWIQIHRINKISSIIDYNLFMINNLPHLVDSNHILVVQADGFVINSHAWKNEFLEYDYIGAPWDLHGCKVWNKKIRIGNGGFSLRSRGLLNLLKTVKNYNGQTPEDSFISDLVHDQKLAYPQTGLAATFSLECPLEDYPFDLTKSFGFHGKLIYDNLINFCPYLFSK